VAKISTATKVPLSSLGTFPKHWLELSLNEACGLVTDGTHDSPKPVGSGFPLVTGKCISQGKIDFKKAYLISQNDHREVIARSKPEKGDVLFANIGNSIGDLASVDCDKEFSIKNVALLKPGKKLNPHFLKYWLKSPMFQNYIKNSFEGSAQPFIGLGTLRSLPIAVPPMLEQETIGNQLRVLEDKIELNNQINETFEAMAKTIFKEWFIDFGPVKAKAEGKKPFGMDDETAALFPDSFEDSELGLIPKGWVAASYKNIFTERSEKIGSFSGEVQVLSAVASGELVPSSEHFNKRVFSEDIGKYKKVCKNDFAYNPSRINIGSIGRHENNLLGAVSPIYLVIEPREKFENYNLFHVRLLQIKEFIKQYSSGSVRQALNINDFLSLPVVVPGVKVVEKFNNLYSVLRSNTEQLKSEIKILMETRDLLLPKLISGEIDLKDLK
jgi:type I restriction enzyme S subunit